MYLRFVIAKTDEQSGRRQGIFQPAYELLRTGNLLDRDYAELDRTLRWFQENLAIPDRFSKTQKPHGLEQAISWFKPNASRHIREARHLSGILEGHDILTAALLCKRPGYITYEDDVQIVAYPFSDTPT